MAVCVVIDMSQSMRCAKTLAGGVVQPRPAAAAALPAAARRPGARLQQGTRLRAEPEDRDPGGAGPPPEAPPRRRAEPLAERPGQKPDPFVAALVAVSLLAYAATAGIAWLEYYGQPGEAEQSRWKVERAL